MTERNAIPPSTVLPDADDKTTMDDRSGLRSFVSYLQDYFRIVSLKSLWFTILFAAILITLNYTIGIEKRMLGLRPLPLSLMAFFLFYGFVLFGAWGIQYSCERRRSVPLTLPSPRTPLPSDPAAPDRRRFLLLLLLAPLYFACKMIHWDLSFLIPARWHYPWDRYTLLLLQLPAKLILLLLMMMACRKTGGWSGSGGWNGSGGWGGLDGLGFTTKKFSPTPYILLLLCLAPLVALASTQPDFLRYYPKVKGLAFLDSYAHPSWPWKLLYEISYGLDFVSIELFFRGFLVIGLARWAGSKTILPMAAFYCTVHFGKPLGECISSFAGGLALGVIAWRTRSILGGLMVHLGLAWMMEIGGWLGNIC